MKKEIDWLNHSLEFIVVIIGILLAFQLSTCSSDRKQAAIVDMHIEQIHEETEYNKSNLEKGIQTSERNLKLVDSLLNLLHLENPKDAPTYNQLSFQLLNIGRVYLRKNAYRSLIDSGDIRFMKNFKEKNRIINLYEYYVWVEGIERLSLNNYKEQFYPYLMDNFDMVKGSIQKPEVYYSKKLKNALATYRYSINGKLMKYKDCLKEIDTYFENWEKK